MTPYTATDWSGFDVPSIAGMLADDQGDAWDQVTAWRAAYETISDHRSQLTRARAELADAWPPHSSPAAASYLNYVESLEYSMSATAEIAITNSSALLNILDALNYARSVVNGLHDQWRAHVVQDADTVAVTTHSPSDTASAAWAEHLNAQAHQTMTETDHIVFTNAQRLQPPVVMQVPSYGESVREVPAPHTPRHALSGSGQQSMQPHTADPRLDSPETALPGRATSLRTKQDETHPTILGQHTEAASSNNEATERGASVSAAAVGLGAGVIGQARAGVSSEPIKAQSTIDEVQPSPDAGIKTGSTRNAAVSGSASERNLDEPGFLPASPQPSPQPETRKRRRSNRRWEAPRHPDGTISPYTVQEPIHDPGPGVIGVDR